MGAFNIKKIFPMLTLILSLGLLNQCTGASNPTGGPLGDVTGGGFGVGDGGPLGPSGGSGAAPQQESEDLVPREEFIMYVQVHPPGGLASKDCDPIPFPNEPRPQVFLSVSYVSPYGVPQFPTEMAYNPYNQEMTLEGSTDTVAEAEPQEEEPIFDGFAVEVDECGKKLTVYEDPNFNEKDQYLNIHVKFQVDGDELTMDLGPVKDLVLNETQKESGDFKITYPYNHPRSALLEIFLPKVLNLKELLEGNFQEAVQQ